MQLQLVQSKDIYIFRHWVFCLFRRSDLSYSWSGSCRSVVLASYCISSCSLIYFYAEQIILVKVFHNTVESSKRINFFGCVKHATTCMLITHLSFSERAHSKKIGFWIKKSESWYNTQATALVSVTQATLLQSKLRVSCLPNVLELKFKTYNIRKFKKMLLSSRIFCPSLVSFFQIGYWISTFHDSCEYVQASL